MGEELSDEEFARLIAKCLNEDVAAPDDSVQQEAQQQTCPTNFDQYPTPDTHFFDDAVADQPIQYSYEMKPVCNWCFRYMDDDHDASCSFGGFSRSTWLNEKATPQPQEPHASSPIQIVTSPTPVPHGLPEMSQYLQQPSHPSVPRGAPGRKTAATDARAALPDSAFSRKPSGGVSRASPMYDQSLPYPSALNPGPAPAPQPSWMPTFQGHFNTFDAAREAVKPPPEANTMIRPLIPGDDLHTVKSQFSMNCARLFAALHADPIEPLAHYKDFEAEYFRGHQAHQLALVKENIRYDPYKSEARVMLLMEQIIDIHENGIPKIVAERTTSRSGYVFEPHICSVRTEKIISVVQSDKYAAQDVLTGGQNVIDLARSPDKFLRKKQESCRGNGLKRYKNKMFQEGMRKASESTASGTPLTPERTPRKRRGGVVDGFGGPSVKRGRMEEG